MVASAGGAERGEMSTRACAQRSRALETGEHLLDRIRLDARAMLLVCGF